MIAILDPLLSLTYCSVSNCLIILSFREEHTQFQMNKTDFFSQWHYKTLMFIVIGLSKRVNENDTKNIIQNFLFKSGFC